MEQEKTIWIPVAEVAREYNKCRDTIKRWCASGFILHLGYRVKKDPKGQWFVSKVEPTHSAQSKTSTLNQ